MLSNSQMCHSTRLSEPLPLPLPCQRYSPPDSMWVTPHPLGFDLNVSSSEALFLVTLIEGVPHSQ